MAVQLASAYMQIIPSMQGFQGTISRQLAGEGDVAGRAVGGRFTGGFKGVVGTGAIAGVVGGIAGAAAATVGGALAAGFSGAKNAIIGFNSTLQQSTIGFTTMLGSAQKAQSFVGQLQSFAAKTPFEFQGLVQNANSLLGMGIASKDILPDLTALGDSVASVGGDSTVLNNTISAFGQIAAKGTVDMGNLNQLLQGGVPNALKILASGFGVTTGQMVKMISTGQVQAPKALAILTKGIENGTSSTAALGGMMAKQSVTMQGALSNISDASTQLLARAFKPLFDQASIGANKLATLLGSPQMTVWAGKINAATTSAITGFHRIAAAVGTFVAGFASGGGAGIGKFFRDIGAALAPLIPAVIGMVTAFSPLRIAFTALAPVLPVITLALARLGAALGQGLSAAVTALAPAIVGIVNGLVAFLVPVLRMAPVIDAVVLGLIAWRVAILGTAAVQGVLAVATNAVGIATKVAAAGQWLLNAAMTANPIGIIIVVIAALVAALIWFFTQTKLGRTIWQNFVSFLTQAWNNILAVGRAVFTAIGVYISGQFNLIRTVITTVINFIVTIWRANLLLMSTIVRTVITPIVNFIHGVFNTIVTVIRTAVLIYVGLWILAWRTIANFIRPVLTPIIAIITGIINTVRTVITNVLRFISAMWQANWTIIRTVVTVVWNAIAAVVTAYINRVRAVVSAVVGFVVAFWRTSWNAIQSVITTVWNVISGVVTSYIARVRSIISAALSFISGIWNSVWNSIASFVSGVLGRIVGVVSSGVSRVIGFFTGLGGRILGAVSGFGSMLFSAGQSLIQGLINGVTGMVGNLVSTVQNIAGNAISAAKNALGIHSPSTVFHGIGQNLGQGLVNGITAGRRAVLNATGDLASATTLHAQAHVDVNAARFRAAGLAPAGAPVVLYPDTITVRDLHGFEAKMTVIASRTYSASQHTSGVAAMGGGGR